MYKTGTTFIAYTPVGSTEAADHAATNVSDYVHPRRTWRSSNITSQWLRLDFGQAPRPQSGIVALVLNNANFPTIQVRASDDANFGSGNVTKVTAGTSVPKDARVNRRKCVFEFAASDLRYLRMDPGGTPDIDPATGIAATYYELGVAAAFATFPEWSENPARGAPYTRQQAETRTPFLGGGEDVNEEGPPYLETQPSAPYFRLVNSTIFTTIQALWDLGPAAPFVVFENAGDISKAYIYRRVGPLQWSESYPTFAPQMNFREPV